MQTLLGILHGLDYLATHLLLGSAIFYLFILPAGGPHGEALEKKKAHVLRVMIIATFFTSLLWLVLSAADMSESWAPQDLWAAMSGTSFGHYGCLRVGILFLLVLGVKKLFSDSKSKILVCALILSLPLFSALTGHAAAQTQYVFWRETLVLLHSVAVAVWTGGLWRLHQWLSLRLQTDPTDPEMSHRVVERFSHFAMGSTGIIGVTGLSMAYWAGVSVLHPLATDYGKLVVIKAVFFATALGAAAVNQFMHLRKWNPKDELHFTRAIRREVRLELVLVTFVFLAAGFLARTSP